MKFLSATSLLLLTAPLTNAAAFSIFDPTQSTLKTSDEKSFPVKGDNPLKYCADPEGYKLLHIESVDLSPNPPLPGQKLTISAKGTVQERIEEGAYVNLVVKWGLITLIKQTVDLCEQLGNVDLKCPLEKGEMILTKDVDLPKQIPPGTYSVLADVYNHEEQQVTCLKADDIKFHV